jgi:hypothetical protein
MTPTTKHSGRTIALVIVALVVVLVHSMAQSGGSDPEPDGISLEEYLTMTPPHPADLTARGEAGGIALRWSPPLPLPPQVRPIYDTRVDHYVVLRGHADGGGFQKLATTQSIFHLDRTAEAGVTYRYVVIAIQMDGSESDFSNEGTAQRR